MDYQEKISAVIITKNEASNIGDCISSLNGVVDQVIVVDAESSDETVKIAKELGANVTVRAWKNYGDQRNFGAKQATNNWILSIDADERLSPELVQEIKSVELDQQKVYKISIKTNYLGKWIKHCGWYPNYKKRMYNRKVAEWSEELVHENLIYTQGMDVVKLKNEILHFSYPSLKRHHEKTDSYARLTAQKWKLENRSPSLLKKLFGSWFRFFRTYVLKLGFLDGKEGFLISKMSALLVKKQLQYFKQLEEAN